MIPVDTREHMRQVFEEQNPGALDDPGTPMQPPPPGADPSATEDVERLLPDFIRQQEAAQERRDAQGTPESTDDVKSANLIAQQVVEARKRGDSDTAEALGNVLEQLVGAHTPKRVRRKKHAHPALQKLRRNLGLQRIKHAEVEWGGSTWQFAPPPPAVDHWVARMAEEALGTFSALQIAASLVGIDGAPVYEVFGVDMVATFEPKGGGETVTVNTYEKKCDACGETVGAATTKCPQCSSGLDPFDMPLNLRLACVDLIHTFFMNEFGPYEELHDLHVKMREQMPNRLDSKEDLYGPFLDLYGSSSTPTKEPTTSSGDEP